MFVFPQVHKADKPFSGQQPLINMQRTGGAGVPENFETGRKQDHRHQGSRQADKPDVIGPEQEPNQEAAGMLILAMVEFKAWGRRSFGRFSKVDSESIYYLLMRVKLDFLRLHLPTCSLPETKRMIGQLRFGLVGQDRLPGQDAPTSTFNLLVEQCVSTGIETAWLHARSSTRLLSVMPMSGRAERCRFQGPEAVISYSRIMM